MAPVLGYWKIRGRGQVIRLLLEHLGVEYEQRLYDKTDGPVWFEKEKHSLGLEFPNLPYFLDGDFKLTEYHAILRYIAEKYDTVGKTLQDRAKVSMLESAASELRFDIARMAYSADVEVERGKLLKRVPIVLRHWSSFLGEKPFLLGDSPLYVDFMLYEDLDVLLYLERTILDETTNLLHYKKRIEELPAIKAYMNSERFIKWPLHAWFAAFGGGDAPPAQ